MRLRWTALTVLVLASLAPRISTAQRTPPQPSTAKKGPVGGLNQNYPNPMNPETWIPFTVGDYPTCSQPGHSYTVSLRSYNTIHQLYAIPVLQRGTTGVAGGQQITKLSLTCGEYKAYWNGKFLNTQREAASGIYPYELEVDGQRFVKKMMVSK